jgi:kynurenine formamidase
VDVGTEQIAARLASFQQPTRSPFGPGDEIGMLNLITPSSRARILAEADAERLFDLSVDFFLGMPTWTAAGDPSFQMWMSHTPAGQILDEKATGQKAHELMAYSGDCISLYTHCGTHIDALNHFGYRGEIWNGFTESEHLGARHWHVCGVDKQPPIVARGVLVDVAAAHGVDELAHSYGIGEEDLRAALARQGSEVRPGDVVLVRTGRMRAWPDRDAFLLDEPGLNREGAEFLAKAGAIVIGGDNIALEQLPSVDPDNWVPVHTYLLAEAGVPIMEVVNLEEIAAEELYEFAFVGAPLKIRGATAAPLRPLALPLRG